MFTLRSASKNLSELVTPIRYSKLCLFTVLSDTDNGDGIPKNKNFYDTIGNRVVASHYCSCIYEIAL